MSTVVVADINVTSLFPSVVVRPAVADGAVVVSCSLVVVSLVIYPALRMLSVASVAELTSVFPLVTVILGVVTGLVGVASSVVIIFSVTSVSLILEVVARVVVVAALAEVSSVVTSNVVMLVLAAGVVVAASFVVLFCEVDLVSIELEVVVAFTAAVVLSSVNNPTVVT